MDSSPETPTRLPKFHTGSSPFRASEIAVFLKGWTGSAKLFLTEFAVAVVVRR